MHNFDGGLMLIWGDNARKVEFLVCRLSVDQAVGAPWSSESRKEKNGQKVVQTDQVDKDVRKAVQTDQADIRIKDKDRRERVQKCLSAARVRTVAHKEYALEIWADRGYTLGLLAVGRNIKGGGNLKEGSTWYWKIHTEKGKEEVTVRKALCLYTWREGTTSSS